MADMDEFAEEFEEEYEDEFEEEPYDEFEEEFEEEYEEEEPYQFEDEFEDEPYEEFEEEFEEEYEEEEPYEFEDEFEGEFEGEYEEEPYEEFEEEFEDDLEYAEDEEAELESPFTEAEEMELAAELLSVTDEDELDMFLGKAFRKARRGIRRARRGVRQFGRTAAGRALRVGLKRFVLPLAGRGVGTYFGGPVGGMIGGQLGGAAGRVFGLELEGLSPEDQEFEVAKRVVRLTGAAARNLARMRPSSTPQKTAMKALAAAARIHAPDLVKKISRTSKPARRDVTGRWVRRGRRIYVLGVA